MSGADDFIARVRATGLPIEKLVVVGSGLLEVLHLRQAQDIDISVAADVFAALATNVDFTADNGLGVLHYHYRHDNIEVWPFFADRVSDTPFVYQTVLENSQVINGVRFITPEFLLMWKRRANRPKDKNDITLLEEYIRER